VSKGDRHRSKRWKRETKYEMIISSSPFSPHLLKKRKKRRIGPSFEGESRAIKMLMSSTQRRPQHCHKDMEKEEMAGRFLFFSHLLPSIWRRVTQHL
jgi:hypothetical protein